MTRSTVLRAALAFLMLIILLVSLAMPLTPIALLIPANQRYIVGALALSFILLLLARPISPIPLPGLFIILVPAAMGLIFAGVFNQDKA